MNRYIALATWLAVVAPGMLEAQHRTGVQNHPDAEAVTRAALDYLEGFYEGDADKIRRGVHTDVVKYGFYRSDSTEQYGGSAMSFDDMIAFTNRMRESGRTAPEGASKEVILLDILDQTAAVKVVAWWGVDYLQLAKYDGEWKILHVIWQSLPAQH
jgi:hypothetical protein